MSYAIEFIEKMLNYQDLIANQDLTVKEVAEREGISSSTVRKRIGYATQSKKFLDLAVQGETPLYNYIKNEKELRLIRTFEYSFYDDIREIHEMGYGLTVEAMERFLKDNYIMLSTIVTSKHVELLSDLLDEHYNGKKKFMVQYVTEYKRRIIEIQKHSIVRRFNHQIEIYSRIDKPVNFLEALKAYAEGKEIYCINEYDPTGVRKWNPNEQSMISWDAIKKGYWFIKTDTEGENK